MALSPADYETGGLPLFKTTPGEKYFVPEGDELELDPLSHPDPETPTSRQIYQQVVIKGSNF